MVRDLVLGVAILVLGGGLVWGLSHQVGGAPPLGPLVDPHRGLFESARHSAYEARREIDLPPLDAPVEVVRDERGVPHVFAESDRDAVITLGYLVARDRLFQLDFLPRAAAGRLSEVFGPRAIGTDRFLRSTGMEWGARRNLRRIEEEDGIEARLIEWYCAGVNHYVDGLGTGELPIEFRLLDYRPDRCTGMQVLRMWQYMNYDLTYETDDPGYSTVRARVGEDGFRTLFPRNSRLYAPIVEGPYAGRPEGPIQTPSDTALTDASPGGTEPDGHAARPGTERSTRFLEALTEGGPAGIKGSNNWAVHGDRSAAGGPLLAGDMHLSLTLPAIWYEAHLVTPDMDIYGVTVPGAPILIEAFNRNLGWAFTNTGADQIDHYALELDSTRTRYRFLNGWRDLTVRLDTIRVDGREPVVDTVKYAHWGPLLEGTAEPMAVQWTAHRSSTTLRALWEMNHAGDYGEFRDALRRWDSPMQNILYADVWGNIAVRSTGYLPIRAAGHGSGLLDGSSRTFEWTGRLPFEDLPTWSNPDRGYLTSTNQQPTTPDYPFYLGHDWNDSFRSLRIDSLLSDRSRHGVEEMKRYQSDVRSMQHQLFVPLLDTLSGLSHRADTLRTMLADWNGLAEVDRAEPLVLDVWLRMLEDLAWDELEGYVQPNRTQLWYLLEQEPASRWLDLRDTDAREGADDLLRMAIERTADSLRAEYGWDPAAWRWGDHHRLVLEHVTGAVPLRPLWRGPYPYPGFSNTLSPGAGRRVTKSASWRMVVDFSERPPRAWGVYPGGQSGNPFSPLYDRHVDTYRRFDYYRLRTPAHPDSLDPSAVSSRWTLTR